MIDPQTALLLAEPGSTRDLIVTAVNGWLLVYDNVSVLPGWLSDGLCRLASSGGFALHSPFSAVEHAMKCPPNTFLSVYLGNRKDASNSSLEDSAVARVVIDFLENAAFETEGTPTEMLDELSGYAQREIRASKDWPKISSKMGNELRRIAPHLRECGIFVSFRKNHKGRFISIGTKLISDDSHNNEEESD